LVGPTSAVADGNAEHGQGLSLLLPVAFEKLREVLRDPQYLDEKLIVFTEHRDTAEFLVRRLESLGFTGQIALIHGGLPYEERERQVEFFRRPATEGGANY